MWNDNGLEVWRLINLDVTQKTQAEILSLEHAVLNPKKLEKLRDIPSGFVHWDNAYRAYVEAGGRPLDDHRKVGALTCGKFKKIKEFSDFNFEMSFNYPP